jgi:hypothetical protein
MRATRRPAGRDLGLMIRVHQRLVTASDGFRYPLTNRFFFLYLLLAWQRRMPHAPDDGFVWCDLIRRLPYWEKNSLQSIGKQIRRHVLQMEQQGRNVIECRERIKGPFRLALPPSAIRFDVAQGEVRHLLDKTFSLGPGRPENAAALYGFVQMMCQGNDAFDAGELDVALGLYEKALGLAQTPEQEVTALQRLGRTLERQAQYLRARELYLRAVRLQRQHPELDDSTMARTYLFLGWLEYRQENYARTRDHYHRALNLARGRHDDWLLGNIFNGLGLLAKREEDFQEALTLLRAALDYWCRANYAYGIQAAYANIGMVYKRWGDHLRDHHLKDQAHIQYRAAIEWLYRHMDFAASARLGRDRSLPQAVLADVHLELGETDRAWAMAHAARETAERAGNQLDLADAILMVGNLHVTAGEMEQGRRLLEEAMARLQQVGQIERAKKIAHHLGTLPKPTPPRPCAA